MAVIAIASGSTASQAQSVDSQPSGPVQFHGLSGLVSRATV